MFILLLIITVLLAFIVMPDVMWALCGLAMQLLVWAVVLAIGGAILFVIFSAFA